MKRQDAIRLLIKKPVMTTDTKSPSVPSSGNYIAALDRLLLDVRAGRIDEFHLDSNSGSHIIITNWQAVEISSAHVIRAGRVNVEPKSQTTLRLRQCAQRTAIPSRCSRCPGWMTSLRPITRCDRLGNG
ncbi:hypothetical protein WCQ02_38090 [Paraburkholderia tropica]|uniref:hypothetical protein n=1 Tax=Paraburkholderia tropica TaxID=92647 RepID=UPI000D750EE4